MALNIKVSGTWRDAVPKVKVAGTWRNVSQAYIKVSGQWRELLQTGSKLFYIYDSNGNMRKYDENGTALFTISGYDVENVTDTQKSFNRQFDVVDKDGNTYYPYIEVTDTFFENGDLRIIKFNKDGQQIYDKNVSAVTQLSEFQGTNTQFDLRGIQVDDNYNIYIKLVSTLFVVDNDITSVSKIGNNGDFTNFFLYPDGGIIGYDNTEVVTKYSSSLAVEWSKPFDSLLVYLCISNGYICGYIDGSFSNTLIKISESTGDILNSVDIPLALGLIRDIKSDIDGNIYISYEDENNVMSVASFDSNFSLLWQVVVPGSSSFTTINVLNSGDIYTNTTQGVFSVNSSGYTQITSNTSYIKGLITEQKNYPFLQN